MILWVIRYVRMQEMYDGRRIGLFGSGRFVFAARP